MRVVAVANQKGGCGKTTTAVNAAACLAFLGKRVLLVDLDSQGHASLGLGITPEDLDSSLYDVMSPRVAEPRRLPDVVVKLSSNLHLVPSDLTISALEQELSGTPGRERRLAEAFDDFGDAYDFVLLDCAPGLGLMTFNALYFANEVLVPVEASLYSLHGLARFIETVRLAEEEFGKHYRFHALITCFDKRTRMARRFEEEVREYLKEMAFKTVIRRNVRLADAATAGKPITEFDRRSHGFKDYMACTSELIERGAMSQAAAKANWDERVEAVVGAPDEIRAEAEPSLAADESEELSDEGIAAAESLTEDAGITGPPVADVIPIEPPPANSVAIDRVEETPDTGEADEATPPPIPPAEPDASRPIVAEIRAEEVKAAETVEKLALAPNTAPQAEEVEETGGFKLGESGSVGDRALLELKLQGPVRLSEGMMFAVADPKAENVKIAGEFNDWRPEDLEMADPGKGLWQIVKPLSEGVYRYKFIINGEWINDPHNSATMANPFGGSDSVVQVSS